MSSDANLDVFKKALDGNQEEYEKTFQNSTGEGFGKRIEYTGKFVMEAVTTKYDKDGEIKEFPSLGEDSKGAARINMLFKVAKGYGTPNVPEGSTAFIGFNMTSKNPVKSKVANTINMFKGKMKALTSEENVKSFKLDWEWISRVVLGKFEDTSDSNGNYKCIKPTELSSLVLVEFEAQKNGNTFSLNDKSMVKAGPNDQSVEGEKLEVKEVPTTPEETVEDSSPSFTSGDNTAAADAVVEEF